MALFPLDPRFSKILLSAKDYGCLYVLPYWVFFSVGVPFLLFRSFQRYFWNTQIPSSRMWSFLSSDIHQKEGRKSSQKLIIWCVCQPV
jgi:HrpA-like RNA helicase